MSSAVIPTPRSSSVKVGGAEREFAKRVALELALQLGLPREDMSEAIDRMINFFKAQGDAKHAAQILIEAARIQADEKKGGTE